MNKWIKHKKAILLVSLYLSNDRSSQPQICYTCLLVLDIPAASNLWLAQNTLQGKKGVKEKRHTSGGAL